MPEQHFIIATAGHVDHGKSSVVKALTGTDPDRLPEEKARGITIDLGFAYFELSAPARADTIYKVGIVDVPGHEDFVKNMVAGVGAIDLALFIIAADDGWMPQTEEHLQILTYLGVNRAVIALTKSDLAESLELVAEDIREHLSETPFAEAVIVPTSTVHATGFAELKTALTAALSHALPPRDIGKPRLSVDRVFTLRGIGTVATGTLAGGGFQRGQTAIVQPSGSATRIRSIQSHNHDVATVPPGTRTALNLPDLTAKSPTRGGIARGDVVTLEELGGPVTTLDVWVQKSARLKKNRGAGRLLKDGTRLRWHHGSANVPARLLLKQNIGPGEFSIGQLRFESPVFVLAGERFILRDWAEQQTIAGGVVLDADARPEGFRNTVQQQMLAKRAAAPTSCVKFAESLLDRDHFLAPHFLRRSIFSDAEVQSALDALEKSGSLTRLSNGLAHAAWWKKIRAEAVAAVEAHHKTHPEQPGMQLSALRSVLGPAGEGAVFEALLADLCHAEFVHGAGIIRRAQHTLQLPPHLEKAGAALRAALEAKPLDPPSRKELAPDAASAQALRFLIDAREAIELSDEIVLLRQPYLHAIEIVKSFLRAHGPATVSELRQALGASRRIVVPLLEKLDKEGITRREGDRRTLKQTP